MSQCSIVPSVRVVRTFRCSRVRDVGIRHAESLRLVLKHPGEGGRSFSVDQRFDDKRSSQIFELEAG
jgi:hypothetical protein